MKGDDVAEVPGDKSASTSILLRKAKVNSGRVTNIAISGAKIGSILLLLAFIYYPAFIWMWSRWFAADSYYAHGPLIPVISGVLIWLKRRELAAAPVKSSKLGLGLLLAGLLLHVVSAFARVNFSSAYSFFFVFLGVILYLFGKKVTRVIFFPLCFLLFMIPGPIAIVAATTLRMKLFAAHMSAWVVELFGIPIIREGSSVYMPNTSTVVGDPCSGLKSLISLSALGILFAYIVKASYPRKIALFLASIPVAIIANIIRTTATLLIANKYGDEIITNGFLHEGFGLMVFVIAFVGLFLVGRLLKCRISQSDT